ncbi:FecR family protein [Pinibacter aurantiacus]|uniref:FecR domain-containing protein n=1 Tax=Pinibacter aurantiacus TaxID=2851599 RepID=A0A9E2W813_9BACT|nr:FecR family protein [Pinibacter aurantiacus]MBV4357332.1 FecR domain-containing protein [Pinibacter aurantiacus]
MNFQIQETEERAQRIAYLVAGFINKTLTTREHDELDEWVGQSDENMELFARLTDERNINEAMSFMQSLDKDSAYDKIKTQIFPEKSKRKWLLPASIAAIVLIAFGIDWFIKSNTVESTPIPSTIAFNNAPDKQPGSAKAVLQLTDGKTIELVNSTNGTVAKEGAVVIAANGESIAYTGSKSSVNATAYNTLTVPKGGRYKLQLSDGSQVWLNAASSIKYPVAFTGNERKVFIEGEAFFEIAKDASKPFSVQTTNASIQVLGTTFNINTYIDEPRESAVLVEGSIKVVTGKQQQILVPGQQANIEPSGTVTTGVASMQEVTGWKDDNFVFKDEPIENIMRQLARWYDVDISYQGKIERHFNASISRKEPLSKILRLLERTGQVRFTMSANKLEVSP